MNFPQTADIDSLTVCLHVCTNLFQVGTLCLFADRICAINIRQILTVYDVGSSTDFSLGHDDAARFDVN